MKIERKLLLLVALLLPVPAALAEGAHADAYYTPYSKFKFEEGGTSGDDDGDGFGFKALVPFGATQTFFAIGEYQSSKLDDSKFDVDQLRLGAGLQTPVSTGTIGAYVDYVKVSIEDSDADGVGLHGRAAFPGAQVYGEVGYLWLSDDDVDDDLSGFEWLVGASYDLTPNLGAFVDFRQSRPEYDNFDAKITLSDLRVGIRLLFDTSGGASQRRRY